MFKLNFEKTAIFVLILIIVISTANIYSQFFRAFIGRREPNVVHTDIIKNLGFPASLLKADQLYSQGMYDDAQNEYFKLTSMQNLSPQQKATVYFKLGVCNYKLNKYELAIDSFLKSTEYKTDDAVAYNNAAVCAFYKDDLGKAEELQKKAVSILPVIEYHYNLARIYEAAGKYEDSIKYYNAVVKAEENITREDRIDPVRIKNKVMKLMMNISDTEKISKELMIALKLKDPRDVFVLEDISMDIKNRNFKWNITKKDGHGRLHCSYDRQNSDPYNLINSIEWVIKSSGKTLYISKNDNFSFSLIDGNSYTVYLNINYSNNKQVSSYADISKSSGTYSNSVVTNLNKNPLDEKPKYYEYAMYEQLFEKNFSLSKNSYVDRFNVVWGRDDIEAKIMTKDFIDAQAALNILNTSDKSAGIWADMSALINDRQLKGRTIRVIFYAKKVSDNADLNFIIRSKVGKPYRNIPKKYQLEDKWNRYEVLVPISENAESLTMSFRTEPDKEIKIDGFIITIVK